MESLNYWEDAGLLNLTPVLVFTAKAPYHTFSRSVSERQKRTADKILYYIEFARVYSTVNPLTVE